MKSWPVQDAKARFSELLDACLREAARPSLKELLLAEDARAEIPVPPRGRLRRRAPRAMA